MEADEEKNRRPAVGLSANEMKSKAVLTCIGFLGEEEEEDDDDDVENGEEEGEVDAFG